MKKLFFFFAMLISVATSAQTLNIKITTIDYSTKIATCDLSWTGRNDTHRSDVWVFVDYIEISGSTTTGSWKPTAITGATVTENTTGNATASTVSGNTRGVWVKSVSSGANFTGQVALQLSSVSEKFNACAYASDYPPNAASYNASVYTLKGTKPFIINGVTVDAKTYSGVINSMTDATGCPGGVGRDVVHNGGTCAPGLTAVGSYCRDLNADGASPNISCGFEVKLSNPTFANGCPSGWSIATIDQLECMRSNASEFGITESLYMAEATLPAGNLANQDWCATCTARRHWYTNPYYSPQACQNMCYSKCVNNYVYWRSDCMVNTGYDRRAKCIR
jgi:hypothetical protein